MRATLVLVAFAFVLLWLVGKLHGASPDLLLFDLLFALAAASSVFLDERRRRLIRMIPFALAAAVGVAGWLSIASNATSWFAWAHVTFAAGLAILGLGVRAPDAVDLEAPSDDESRGRRPSGRMGGGAGIGQELPMHRATRLRRLWPTGPRATCGWKPA